MVPVPGTVLFELRGTLVDAATGWRLTDAQRTRSLRACGARATESELRQYLERAIADVNALTFRRREYFEQDRLVLERAAELAGVNISEARLDAFERWRNRAFARAVHAKDVRMAEAVGAQALLLDRSGTRDGGAVETISSLLEILDRPLAATKEDPWRKTVTT